MSYTIDLIKCLINEYIYIIIVQDEVLAESEKVVLKVEDLITWIVTDPVSWPIGHLAIKASPDPQLENGKSDDLLKVFAANNSGLNFKDVLREQQSLSKYT